jgi:putative intracellular protease/amidase
MKAMILVSNGLEECEALLTYDLLYRAGIETFLVGLSEEGAAQEKHKGEQEIAFHIV